MSSGTVHFIAQRASAVVLAFLGGWFAIALAGLDSLTYLDAQRFVADRTNAWLLSALCAVIALHSYLGVEVVIEDYVHAKVPRNLSLLMSRIVHSVLAIAAVYAIAQIGSGS